MQSLRPWQLAIASTDRYLLPDLYYWYSVPMVKIAQRQHQPWFAKATKLKKSHYDADLN
jgi:hypothetical protein